MKEILRYLLRRKLRTALTILAVTVGIFAVTAVGGIAEEMEKTIRAVENDALQRLGVYTEGDLDAVSDSSVRQLRRLPGVAGVTESLMGTLVAPDDAPVQISINPEMFVGVRSDIPGLEYEPPVMGVALWDGRLPESRTEAVVTWPLAQAHDLRVGDALMIRERPFKVVGIWEDAPTASGRIATIDYDMAADMLGQQRFYRSVSVIPAPGIDLEALATRIETEIPDVVADSPTEMAAQARQEVMIFSLIVGASGIISLLIGTFTIVNTMVVSVQERQREIGLKKALGAEDRHVLSEIVLEAVIIAGVGGVVGVAGAAVVGNVANRLLAVRMGTRLFQLSPRLGVGVIVFSMFMGVIAGLYPAWRAAKLDPIVALRGMGSGAVFSGRGLKRLIYLARRNARSILTVGGIAVGIFALVLLGSLSEALNTYLNNVTTGTQNLYMIAPTRPGVIFGRSMVRQLHNLPGVQDVGLANYVELPIIFGEDPDGEAVKTEVWAHESLHGDWGFAMPVVNRIAEGRAFDPYSVDEVMVGAGLAEVQGISMGDVVHIDKRPFTVVGIWDRIPFDLNGNENSAYMSIAALERLKGPEAAYGGLSVRTEPGDAYGAVAALLRQGFPDVRAYGSEEIFGQIRQIFVTLIAVMVGIFSIAVFVGAVSVVNTMVIAVNEQVPEIGLKKAVGAEDGDILAEVLLQAAKLGAIGGGIGIGLAWVAALIVNPLVKAQVNIDILHLSPRLVLGALAFSLVLGMVSGMMPARRAARLDPAVALRAE
ncbi:MAG: ABC transporter permease [Anaerolineae bacterium]|nr:ABC transporter permease [Anaerolineae bacterium]